MPAKVKAEAAQLVMEIPDIREFIMINLEPQSMFNLIFASPAALRTYNMDPQIYLNAAVHELPEYLRAWAKALLQVTKGGPCGGTETPFLDLFRTSLRCDGWADFLDKIIQPVQGLKKLAVAAIAVDTLANSDLNNWVSDADQYDEWSATGRRDGHEIIRHELWRFELYCELSRRMHYGGIQYGWVDPSILLKVHLCFNIKTANLRWFQLVFRGLTSFVAQTYSGNVLKDFESVYQRATEDVDKVWYSGDKNENKDEDSRDRSISIKARSTYMAYVDNQLSRGIPYLAYIQYLKTTANTALDDFLHTTTTIQSGEFLVTTLVKSPSAVVRELVHRNDIPFLVAECSRLRNGSARNDIAPLR